MSAATREFQEQASGVYRTLRDYIHEGDLLHRTAGVSIVAFVSSLVLLPVLVMIDSDLFDRMFAYFVGAAGVAVFGSLFLIIVQEWVDSESAEALSERLSSLGLWEKLQAHVTRRRGLALVYFCAAPFVAGFGGPIAGAIITGIGVAWFFYELGRERGQGLSA